MKGSLLVYFFLLCLLAAFLFFSYGKGRGRGNVGGNIADSDSSVLWPAIQDPAPSATVAKPLGKKEAEKLVSESLAIRNADSIGGSFILSEDTTPETALSILTDLIESEGEITNLTWIGTRYVGGNLLEGVVVEIANGEDISRRLAQIPHGYGNKIDFDSFIRSTSHPWDAILSKQTESAVVRVNIKKSNYYNGTFSDDAHWNSYAISSPDIQRTLYGYAERDSPQDLALAEIVATEDTIPRAVLEIGAASTAGKHQFFITQVIAEDWVITEKR